MNTTPTNLPKDVTLTSIKQLILALAVVSVPPANPLKGRGNARVRLKLPIAQTFSGKGSSKLNLSSIAEFVPKWTVPQLETFHERLHYAGEIGEKLLEALSSYAGKNIGKDADMVYFINAICPGHATMMTTDSSHAWGSKSRWKTFTHEPFVSAELATAILNAAQL